ncbi:MAG: RNA polymerase sigma factor [Firmicutes bacterium]|nr:RNA polymerase sigma factor [Bacillota bacterium]
MEIDYMEDIIEKYQFSIFRYCFQMLRCKEAAEDITQEVFIKFSQISKKKIYSNNYLYSIAHSKCIDYIRREKRKKLFIRSYKRKTYEISTEDLISQNEYSKEMKKALNSLTSYERSVLLLKSVNGFTYKEMSNILNKKESALRKQFQRAKTKIEKELNKKGVMINNEEISIL